MLNVSDPVRRISPCPRYSCPHAPSRPPAALGRDSTTCYPLCLCLFQPLTANPSRLRRAGRVGTASRPSLPRVGTRRRRVRPRPSSPHPHGRDTVAPVGMTGPVILGRAGRAPLPRNKKAGDQGIYPPAPGPRFPSPSPRVTVPTCPLAVTPPCPRVTVPTKPSRLRRAGRDASATRPPLPLIS